MKLMLKDIPVLEIGDGLFQWVQNMEKTATLNLRVNPNVKERAEAVLSRLGVPMSTAIDMYLNQISLTGGDGCSL